MFSDIHSDYGTSDFSECVDDKLLIVDTSIPFEIEVECEQDDAAIEINRDLSCSSVPSSGNDEFDERSRDADQYETFISFKVAKNQRFVLGDAYMG